LSLPPTHCAPCHLQALWSAVYYVARGSGDATPDSSDGGEDEMDGGPLRAPASADGEEADARSAGSLVLKTQLVPFTHSYGYLPIAPRAGDLWVFPGYLSHAVLPRTLLPPPAVGEGDATAAASPTTSDLPRVSVAINVQRKASVVGDPTNEVARAMRKLYAGNDKYYVE